MKSIRIWSYSGPHFPAFGLNTGRYSVSLCVQSECTKTGSRATPDTDTVYAVNNIITIILLLQYYQENHTLFYKHKLCDKKEANTGKRKQEQIKNVLRVESSNTESYNNIDCFKSLLKSKLT